MQRLATIVLAVSLAAVSTSAAAQTADLAVTRTGSADPIAAGTDLTSTIVVANNGPDAAANATLTDVLPPGVTFVSLTAPSGWQTSTPAVGSGGTVSATNRNVANGATATFTLVVHGDPAPRGSTICSTATVASTTVDPNPANNSSTTISQVKGSEADLAVTITDSPDPVAPDGNLTYAIVVTNNGPDAAASATLSDVLPTGVTFVSLGAPADWLTIMPAVGTGGTVTATTPTLANGATAKFALVVHVDPAAPGGPAIGDTATIGSATIDPAPGNNSASTTTATKKTQGSRADLAVTKTSSPDPVLAGAELTSTIVVTNNGPDGASATLTDALPPGVTFASLSAAAEWETITPAVGSSGTVTATNPTVANGTTATFTLVVRVDPATRASTIRNTAAVASTTSDPAPENNSATATTKIQETRADLAVTKTDSPDPVVADGDLTYTIVVTNDGPDSAANVTLNDVLPPEVTFISLNAPADWQTTTPAVESTGTVTATNPTLTNGETATFTLVVHVNPAAAGGSTISNTATVASASTDPAPENDSATTTTQVQGAQADLAASLAASPDPVVPGNDITYLIAVTNNGPDDAANVGLIDPFPPGGTLVSFSAPTGWAAIMPVVGSAGTVSASTSILPKGATATFRLILRVDLAVPVGSTLANTVTVTGPTPDPTTVNNSVTVTTTTAGR
jgi:uncharacterized repeat protein (TIGR01451 family)